MSQMLFISENPIEDYNSILYLCSVGYESGEILDFPGTYIVCNNMYILSLLS